MGDSRHYQPQIPIAPLETIAHHQLINLQGIAWNRRQERFRKAHTTGGRLFLSTLRTVSRPHFKLRAMARCDKRSPKAASINASFSALRRRPGPSGVHVLRHDWQRRRRVPLRLKPKRITGSSNPQKRHDSFCVTMKTSLCDNAI